MPDMDKMVSISHEVVRNIKPNLLSSAIIVIIAVVLLIGFRFLVAKYRKKQKESNKYVAESTLFSVTVTLGQLTFIVIIILTVMAVNGVNITAFITGLGIAGAILGLALQDMIKDILMGFRFIQDDYFKVGDVIKYKDMEGIVIFQNLMTTKVESIYDHCVYSIANRNISEMVKVSSQVDIDMNLSYEEDMEHVYKTFKAIVKEVNMLDEIEACMFKGTQAFEAQGVVYKLRFYCNPHEKPDITRKVNRIVQRKLHEANINIPYPFLTLTNRVFNNDEIKK